MLKKKNEIEKKICILKDKLETFPPGTFICARNRKNYKWYVTDGKNKSYIPKKEVQLAEQLAYKKLLSIQLSNLEQELKAIKAYLRHYDPNAIQKEIEILNHPEYRKLLSKFQIEYPKTIEAWVHAKYEKYTAYSERLIHKAPSGNYVRSKSEVLIDMILSKHGIPFHYEETLYLNGFVVHPDFTILHPTTKELIYWEHVGLAEDPDYLSKFTSKLQRYISNGIIPNINLILTFETKEHPLTIDTIEALIEQYFGYHGVGV